MVIVHPRWYDWPGKRSATAMTMRRRRMALHEATAVEWLTVWFDADVAFQWHPTQAWGPVGIANCTDPAVRASVHGLMADLYAKIVARKDLPRTDKEEAIRAARAAALAEMPWVTKLNPPKRWGRIK